MPAYTRGMSTTETRRPTAARPKETEVLTAVPVRRSILRTTRPTRSSPPGRGRLLRRLALPSRDRGAGGRARPRRPARRAPVRRHLRCALTGTLLAIVAITGLSAYAAQGIADARSTALCQAHITCK